MVVVLLESTALPGQCIKSWWKAGIFTIPMLTCYYILCFCDMLFYNMQMNVKKAMDKLSEWNNVGNKLRHHIPENDGVLHSWLSQLEEFSQDLPLLLQLSSDALKVKSMLQYCICCC